MGKGGELVMWIYDKKLQYPVKIKNPNPKMAQIIMTQIGGPDGELGASLRYLNQRYTMPTEETKGLLTDIGRCVSEMAIFSIAKLHLYGSIFRYTSM